VSTVSSGKPQPVPRPFLLPVLWGYTRERDPDLLVYPDDDWDFRALDAVREAVGPAR
jgi:hypothetical protein